MWTTKLPIWINHQTKTTRARLSLTRPRFQLGRGPRTITPRVGPKRRQGQGVSPQHIGEKALWMGRLPLATNVCVRISVSLAWLGHVPTKVGDGPDYRLSSNITQTTRPVS